ncbi:MAG: GntR family transcriptional regulator [Chitinivibrionales bacterium]|nr:GntR family transcriptional regulator [Chitinivibrionales bacterium]
MNGIKKPAVQKAYAGICKSISSGDYPLHQPLPSLSALSAEIGVSRNSVLSALKKLSEDSIVVSKRSVGYFPIDRVSAGDLLNETTYESASVIESDAVDRIVSQLKHDIAGGAFSRKDMLPSIKSMCTTYATSYRSMKKALSIIADEGLIVMQGSRRRITLHNKQGNLKLIRILTLLQYDGKIPSEGFIPDMIRLLELESDRLGYSIELIGYFSLHESHIADYDDPDSDVAPFFVHYGETKPFSLADSDQIAGYIHLVGHNTVGSRRVDRWLSHVNKPISLFDAAGGAQLPPFLSKPHIRFFACATSRKAGLAAGNAALQAGHRRIAYISPFHEATWSRNRLKGLQQAFLARDAQRSIQAFTLNRPSNIYGYYFRELQERCDYKPLNDAFVAWKKSNPAEFGDALEHLFKYEIPIKMLPGAVLGGKLQAIFANALAQEGITLWVCANDWVALQALAFCKANEANVAGKIAILGFDNSSGALVEGLTSFDFGLQTLAGHMLSFLVNMRMVPLRKRPVEVAGRVIFRRSM